MTVENGVGIKFNASTAMAKIRLYAAKEEEVTVLERSFLQSISYTNHESSPLTFHLDCANAGTTLRGHGAHMRHIPGVTIANGTSQSPF